MHGLRRRRRTKGPQAEFRRLWHGQGPDDLARRSGQRSVGLYEEVVTRTRYGRRKHAELGAAEGLAALVVRNAGTVEFLCHEVGVEENASSVDNDVWCGRCQDVTKAWSNRELDGCETSKTSLAGRG